MINLSFSLYRYSTFLFLFAHSISANVTSFFIREKKSAAGRRIFCFRQGESVGFWHWCLFRRMGKQQVGLPYACLVILKVYNCLHSFRDKFNIYWFGKYFIFIIIIFIRYKGSILFQQIHNLFKRY